MFFAATASASPADPSGAASLASKKYTTGDTCASVSLLLNMFMIASKGSSGTLLEAQKPGHVVHMDALVIVRAFVGGFQLP